MADLVAPPGLADRINAAHAAAEAALRSGLEHARACGELLLQAKEQCAHGAWLPWLNANVRCSPRTAQAYMRIAREWDRLAAKSATVAHLGFREAVGLLADPADETPDPSPPAPETEGPASPPPTDQAVNGEAANDPEAAFRELLATHAIVADRIRALSEIKIRTERALGFVLKAAVWGDKGVKANQTGDVARRAVANALRIGGALAEAKGRLGAAQFDSWAKAEFNLRPDEADDYMRVASSADPAAEICGGDRQHVPRTKTL